MSFHCSPESEESTSASNGPQARGGGHELSNLRWVCAEANILKRELTDEELLEICSEVAEWIGRRLGEIAGCEETGSERHVRHVAPAVASVSDVKTNVEEDASHE